MVTKKREFCKENVKTKIICDLGPNCAVGKTALAIDLRKPSMVKLSVAIVNKSIAMVMEQPRRPEGQAAAPPSFDRCTGGDRVLHRL